MEVESKYAIPDVETFQQLQALTALGEYTLKEPVVKTITDTYLDTATGLLRQGGFACRVRHNLTQGRWLGTVKGLGGVSDGIHRREEFEIEIPADAPPQQWPPSEARDIALHLSQSQAFSQQFSINQIRQIRFICLHDLTVAEWSLDKVSFLVAERSVAAFELEIELKEKGTLNDLRALSDLLTNFNLTPEPLSKFERGLRLVS